MLTKATKIHAETILCAAIHIDDGKSYKGQPTNIATGLVLSGHRHGNCFQLLGILDTYPSTRFDGKIEQGFLTSQNRFVNRKQAYTIARAQQQIISAHQPQRGHLLSEDLY